MKNDFVNFTKETYLQDFKKKLDICQIYFNLAKRKKIYYEYWNTE